MLRRTDWSARYRVARAALNLTLTGQRALLRHTNQQLLPVSASRNVRKLLYILFNLESTGAVTGTALSCVLPSTLSPLSDSCCPPLVRKDTLDSNCTCVVATVLNSWQTIVCWTGKRRVPILFAWAVRGKEAQLITRKLVHQTLPPQNVFPFTFSVPSLQQCASRPVLQRNRLTCALACLESNRSKAICV